MIYFSYREAQALFIKIFSLPLFVTGILSLGFFIFFLLFSQGMKKVGKDTRSFFVFSLVVLSIASYSLSFFIQINSDNHPLSINIFNRLAIVSSTYIFTFFIQFIGVFYNKKPAVSLTIFHIGSLIFALLAIIPNTWFLSPEIFATSQYYPGLVRGPLFFVWGVFLFLMMGHASVILWINYNKTRKKTKQHTSLVLFISSLFWVLSGIFDGLTAMGMLDVPPISWIGALLMVFSIARLHMNDIRELFLHSQDLYNEVIHDQMTGAFSRSFINVELEKGLDRIRRNLKDQIYLIMIDIDYFKAINDSYGHLCGDEVLRHVVRMTEKSVRKLDIVARIGGDEFLVLIHEPITLEDMKNIVERIRDLIIHTPFEFEDKTVEVRISIGVSSPIPRDNRELLTPDMLYSSADSALYEAKEKGRNRVAFSQYLGTR